MFNSEFEGKCCSLQRHVTHGDEILFSSGEEFVMTGRVKMYIKKKVGRIITEIGVVPRKQQGRPLTEIFVDERDIIVLP